MKLVIFDVDGTLVDSQAQIYGAMTRAFAAIGRDVPTRADIRPLAGLSLPEAMLRIAPDLDADGQMRLVDGYWAAYAALRDGPASPLYAGAAEVLAALVQQNDTALALATGNSRRQVEHLSGLHGWDGLFASIQTADDHPSKPHPSMIETCLADTGADRAQTVMLGDTVMDMQMARAAGVTGLGVAWGYHSGEALTAAGAATIVPGFQALLPWLEDFWGTA